MKVVIGADHAGFELKQCIKALLLTLKHQVLDLGTHTTQPVDYSDHAEAVGLAVRSGQAERGIVLCGSGIGASVAANKIPGIRAGLCHDHYSAHQGVEHDDITSWFAAAASSAQRSHLKTSQRVSKRQIHS